MSTTHSYIGIQNSDGTIQAVYCHNFGYPEGLGVTLQTHYNSLAAALEIMKLGDLSFLGKKLNPPSNQVHSWENPSQDISIAFVLQLWQIVCIFLGMGLGIILKFNPKMYGNLVHPLKKF
jgi:hypothetical protein